MKEAFDRAYAAVTALVADVPELAGFGVWPAAAVPRDVPANPVPAADLVHVLEPATSAVTHTAYQAIRDIAPFANWQHTYTEAEVGADFLARYGWFELVGPFGHFHATDTRAYIAFWGRGLVYPWHVHEAEEIYFVLSGEAQFETEGAETEVLGPGGTRFHRSWQPHALTTRDDLLTLVLWRGAGLDGEARMGTA